jgi:glycogen debranching enzyme
MRKCIWIGLLFLGILAGCQEKISSKKQLAKTIMEDARLDSALVLACQTVKGGFDAGTIYPEVWIRDMATYIELSLEVQPAEDVKKALLRFFAFQGDDGNIPDGYVRHDKVKDPRYKYRFSDLEPDFRAHKNTVITDQESSLILAIAYYINITGDKSILDEKVGGETVLSRCTRALQYVLNDRFSEKYGLITGATTIDWGDFQPEHEWGTFVNEDTHWSISGYNNAWYAIAVRKFLKWLPNDGALHKEWMQNLKDLKAHFRQYLWDGNKIIPHIYLADSPFPESFDENKIYFHGGTCAAIMAGFLTEKEVVASFRQMIKDKEASGAMSVGITIYPPYPEGYFKNPDARPFCYINGGDWTWWGGRIIQAMVDCNQPQMAYNELLPIVKRSIADQGYYEWYSPKTHKPYGTAQMRGAAGVTGIAIEKLREWAKEELKH